MNNVNKVGKVIAILLLLTCFVSTALAAPLAASIVVEGTTLPSVLVHSNNGNVPSVYPVKFWFVDASTGDNLISPTASSFNFGDGSANVTTAWKGEVNHIYTTPGTYTVVNTVTNSTLNTSSAAVQVVILPKNTVPIASFSRTPASGNAPLTVAFTDLSLPNGTTGMSWSWNFGDGSPLNTTQNPTHIYNTGTWNAQLTVTAISDNGTSVTSVTPTQSIVVTTNANAIPDFTASVTSGNAPLTVTFTNTSIVNGITVNSLAWDFGDGNTTGAVPANSAQTHTYYAIGKYNVKLTINGVNSESGVSYANSTIKAGYINVTGTTPINTNVVNFTIFPSSTGNSPFLVYFNASASTGSITKLHWDFGDGNSIDSTNKDATVVDYYTLANTYPVKLTVTYSDLTTSNVTKTITVTNNVITKLVDADFSANPTSGKAPLTVQFTDNSTNVNGWFWNFGDGISSNMTNPSHVYTAPGIYTASLIVLNGNLLTSTPLDQIIDSKQMTITVTTDDGTVTPPIINNNSSCHFESNPSALIINDFVTTPTSGTVPLSTNSVSSITNSYPIVCWKWDFEPIGNDMYSSHPVTAVHTFTHVGSFDIRLTVKDSMGNIATMQKNGYVNVAAPSVTGNNTCNNICNATCDTPCNTPCVTPCTKPCATPSVTPAVTTCKNPCATPCEAEKKKSCAPAKPSSSCAPAKPKTECKTSSQFKLTGKKNCKVNIKCSTKTPVSGVVVNYGDGKGSNCLTSTHQYKEAGTYTVTVTAKNSSGCTVKKTVGTVTIS